MHPKWTYLLVGILASLDILVLSAFIWQSKQTAVATEEVRMKNGTIADMEYQNDIIWHSYLRFNSAAIRKMMDSLLFETTFQSDSAITCLFIPPNACGTCTQDQCELLRQIAPELHNMLIISPTYKKRDMYTWFANSPNIHTSYYDASLIENDEILALDKLIVFQVQKNQIYNVMLTDKNHPEWTKEYYALNSHS